MRNYDFGLKNLTIIVETNQKHFLILLSYNAQMIHILIFIVSFILAYLIYKYKLFTLSRAVYLIISFFIGLLIFGRLACESLDCIKYLPLYLYQKYCGFENLLPKDCKTCEPDWKLRDGVDEAGLMLVGLFIAFLFFYIKNKKINELIAQINSINLFGTVQIDNLAEKIDKYEATKFNKVEANVEDKHTQNLRNIINNSSNNDERLSLMVLKIEELINELHSITKFSVNSSIPTSIQQTIVELEQNQIIDKDLADILTDFSNVKIINANKLNGKKTLSLIETGARILRILQNVTKRIFKANNIFYGNEEVIKIDRLKIDSISKNEIVICATVNMTDSNENHFPIDNLEAENILIMEYFDNEVHTIKVNKVIPFDNVFTKFYIVILIDCSGSMRGEKLDKSKNAAIQLIKELSHNKNLDCIVGIYKISNKNRGFVNNTWFKVNSAKLPSKIMDLQADGSTPLWQSIDHALTIISNPNLLGNKMLICLTDGKNELEEQSIGFENLTNIVKILNIPIISVGFGQEDYSEMIELSKTSGAGGKGVGYFVEILPNDLKGIFANIASSITKSYKIFWKPTFAQKDKKIDVKLIISFKNRNQEMKKAIHNFFYVTE